MKEDGRGKHSGMTSQIAQRNSAESPWRKDCSSKAKRKAAKAAHNDQFSIDITEELRRKYESTS